MSGFGSRLAMTVIAAAVFAVVAGAVWYVVVPGMYGGVAQQTAPQSHMDGVLGDVRDGAAMVIGGAADGLDSAADGIGSVVGGLDATAGDLGGAAEELGAAADSLGEAVSGIVPGAEPAGTAGGPDWPGAGGPGLDPAETPEDGIYYVRNDTGFRETLTHRYVMYPPCAAVLDGMGKEVRTIFGIPTPIPQDSGARLGPLKALDPNHLASEGFAPKPCSFDYNGNGLGDGWEDNNNDGYADGFTDCTKPYVFQDGWYVRELGRDCKYGAPAARAYEGVDRSGSSAQDSSSSSSSSSQSSSPSAGGGGEPTGSEGSGIPYATALAGTITRVIDGDTIVVDGETRIRLALVDTPERGEPGYEEASAFTRSKCPVGTTVIYDADDGQRSGSYGRTIALVWCGGYGSTSSQAAAPLNELLLEAGHAEIDRRFCTASEFGDDEWALRGGC